MSYPRFYHLHQHCNSSAFSVSFQFYWMAPTDYSSAFSVPLPQPQLSLSSLSLLLHVSFSIFHFIINIKLYLKSEVMKNRFIGGFLGHYLSSPWTIRIANRRGQKSLSCFIILLSLGSKGNSLNNSSFLWWYHLIYI